MKLFIIFLALASFSLFGCSNQETEDYVYLFSYFKGDSRDGLHLAWSEDGLTWKELNGGNSFLKPNAGRDKLMRDPCIIKGADGLFHMVWTVSWAERGIGYANSPDLLNWSEQKYIPVMEHEENARNCWAPEITYCEKKGIYMIYWATTIEGAFPETWVPEDDGLNHRMYYVTTRDFKEFSDTKILYEPGFNVIDSHIVPFEGEFIMFLKDETRTPPAKSLHVARSGNLTGPFSQPGDVIHGNYWAEGPTSLYIDGNWIVYFDIYRDRRMGAVTSNDLENWTEITDQVTFPPGTRHGTALKVKRSVLDNIIASTSVD
ncbi:glycoside hydrolase family 43 protein [Natronoflexus pectinivorans]|uniref:Glycosyl hydrolase family 43 n=1 Tax=Natronoflexus pectinivorans TaxID=682526 RepID=A0A4R2GQH1_9BACT|nr:glycoside hydrolase family 43 protein [Natronoflexus pectinivorans]TCO10979.1 glycosyl hydrolase family 43 [Natronoflexus pectinivorans]